MLMQEWLYPFTHCFEDNSESETLNEFGDLIIFFKGENILPLLYLLMTFMLFSLNILVDGCYFNETEITFGASEVKMLVILL